MKGFLQRIGESKVWRSIFRSGLPTSNLGRSLVIYDSILLHILPVKTQWKSLRFSATFYLGFISIALLVILIVTGVYLMFYYHPTAPQAYWDMKDLQFVVANGVFIRNLHRWAAHAMVGVVFLHMLRVFYAGAYRPPKQFNWVIGVFLLGLTLLLSYTGYLLPWDQLAYWGVSVGTNMADSVPLIGGRIKYLLLGGHVVGENTLIRFYVLHCTLLPLAIAVLVAVHIWRVRKDGGITPLFKDREQIYTGEESDGA